MDGYLWLPWKPVYFLSKHLSKKNCYQFLWICIYVNYPDNPGKWNIFIIKINVLYDYILLGFSLAFKSISTIQSIKGNFFRNSKLSFFVFSILCLRKRGNWYRNKEKTKYFPLCYFHVKSQRQGDFSNSQKRRCQSLFRPLIYNQNAISSEDSCYLGGCKVTVNVTGQNQGHGL